ncbi:hypothetical protein H6F42_02475 [Pseudanabaena sp. FACHB-1998]|uniref:hypothetical protein n=1 Tax=Pseudanabaena sp. FACHB-1998 TaxID=2692858 RepID=UPI001680E374|nr:hypothetical protein [Pseudanabaena sp. FACHB-1998]MBD2175783.1 hypothetical protein [Pseudanabaena sp. FACHB-1998]
MWEKDHKILSELISNNVEIPLIPLPNSSNEVTLTENIDNTSYSIKIKGLPKETFILKADEFPALLNFFKGLQGECKRADYVIFTNIKNKKIAIFLELKSGNPDNKDSINQLKGAFCLYKYLQKVGQIFWGYTNFLMDYEIEFAVIKEIPQKIKLKKQSPNFRRENLVSQIPLDNSNSLEIPKYFLSLKYQQEIYFRTLL